MLFNTLRWRRIGYTAWSAVYDPFAMPLEGARRRSIALLAPRPGERLLLVGAGTGLDLHLLPAGVHLTAIDLTPAMLARLRRRAARLAINVDARVMNAQAMDFPDSTFDAAVLHLILAVVPDPVACAREVARVLRPGGRAVILDKFLPDDRPTPAFFRFLNPLASFFGTEITRRLGPILDKSGLNLVSVTPAGATGYLKIALAQKDHPTPPTSGQSHSRHVRPSTPSSGTPGEGWGGGSAVFAIALPPT